MDTGVAKRMRNNSNIVNFYAKEYIRERLESSLDKFIDKQLIMVVEPSGYGKSTLVRHYFNDRPYYNKMWFPMQSKEKDDNWVWKRLCQKLGEYSEELKGKLSDTQLPQSKQELSYIVKILRQYVNDTVYLIVDDYQECASVTLDNLIMEVVDNIDNIHIVLISRILPYNIPYEAMFLKGQSVLITQQDLKLTKDEEKVIFKENEINLTAEEADLLYEHTDGWISAVYLSLYEYKKLGRMGGFLSVNHLLKTTIFDKLSADMQEFFMKMSLFDWFDIEGAEYVTQLDVTENDLLESVEQFGFLDYDVTTHSFAMHTLLRNVSGMELNKSDIEISMLYNRAAEVSEKRKSYIKAVAYYTKAKNWDRIAALYAGKNGRRLIERAPGIFQSVRENIEEVMWEKYPTVMLNYLYYMSTKENVHNVMPLYEEIINDINNHPIWKDNKFLMGEMMIILSILQFNNLEKMNQSLIKVREYFGERTSVIFGNSLLTYGTTCMTTLYYNKSGRLKEIIEQEKEYAKAYMRITQGSRVGWDEFFDAEYAMITGDIDTAYRLAKQVLLQNILRNQTCIIISCYYMILKCLIYYGKKEEFYEGIEKLNELTRDITYPLLIIDAELVQGYVYACLGQQEKMSDWLQNFRLENCSKQIRNIRSGCMTYGKLMCYKKDWAMLDMIGQQMMVPYENTSHIYPFITGCVYRAIAQYNMGNTTEAERYIKWAVELSYDDNVIMPFIENGVELEPVIENVYTDGFLESLKPYIAKYKAGIESFNAVKDDNPYKLTKREKELMEYVKAGYKNSEISEQMHIALVTVEKNLTSVYRKLGVTNRTSAIMMLQK